MRNHIRGFPLWFLAPGASRRRSPSRIAECTSAPAGGGLASGKRLRWPREAVPWLHSAVGASSGVALDDAQRSAMF